MCAARATGLADSVLAPAYSAQPGRVQLVEAASWISSDDESSTSMRDKVVTWMCSLIRVVARVELVTADVPRGIRLHHAAIAARILTIDVESAAVVANVFSASCTHSVERFSTEFTEPVINCFINSESCNPTSSRITEFSQPHSRTSVNSPTVTGIILGAATKDTSFASLAATTTSFLVFVTIGFAVSFSLAYSPPTFVSAMSASSASAPTFAPSAPAHVFASILALHAVATSAVHRDVRLVALNVGLGVASIVKCAPFPMLAESSVDASSSVSAFAQLTSALSSVHARIFASVPVSPTSADASAGRPTFRGIATRRIATRRVATRRIATRGIATRGIATLEFSG